MYLYIFYLHIWNISEFDQKWQCRRFSSALQNWLSLTLGLFSEGFEEEWYRYPSVLNVIKCLSSDKILFVPCALVNWTISSFEDSLVVNPKHQLATLRFYHWAYNLHSQGKLNRTSESAIRQKQSNWPFRTLCFFLPQSALFRASICAEESNLLYQFLIQMPDFSIPYYYYPVYVLLSVCFIFSFSLLSMVETIKLKLSRNKLCPSRVMSV